MSLEFFWGSCQTRTAATQEARFDENQLENDNVPFIHRNTKPAHNSLAPRRILRLGEHAPVTSTERCINRGARRTGHRPERSGRAESVGRCAEPRHWGPTVYRDKPC